MSGTETLLPPELERAIFEYTAEFYPYAIPRLIRVAHRVLVWIEPIAYRRIEANSSRRFSSFLAASRSKPPEFFAQHVRTIFIRNSFDDPLEDACAALALCTSVTRIAGAGPLACQGLLPVIAPMRLERIALFLTHIFPSIPTVDFGLPCFQTLTHFDVFDYLQPASEEEALVYAAKLCTLPVLTHLSLNGTVPWSAVEMLLRDCRCLEILVLLWPYTDESGQERAAQVAFDDVRFVMTGYRIYEEAVWDPPNYWTQAEAFITDKRQGKIDSRCFWMAQD
ncbi:hypothetical protein C8F01DRAFT_749784 [Mycena amicta]|nr:hypothetical protein C8F01DRAFT_749784 [Mycena amicta]